MFAILADVRNGYGFAGVNTGRGFIPIDEPRGLPNDVTEEVKKMSDDYGSDGHSHSYFTVREIKEYNWDQVTSHCGVVNNKEYAIFKEKGKPESWSGSIWGPDVNMVSNEEMDGSNNKYTSVEWTETYRESAGKRFFDAIHFLSSMAENDDDVRIVFWFDN